MTRTWGAPEHRRVTPITKVETFFMKCVLQVMILAVIAIPSALYYCFDMWGNRDNFLTIAILVGPGFVLVMIWNMLWSYWFTVASLKMWFNR